MIPLLQIQKQDKCLEVRKRFLKLCVLERRGRDLSELFPDGDKIVRILSSLGGFRDVISRKKRREGCLICLDVVYDF